MTALRKTALAAGVLHLLSFVSIPTLGLYSGLRDPAYVVGPGSGTGVIWGAVVKRQNQARALGFVGTRVLEGATIISGIVIVMSMVTLRETGAGPQALPTAQALVAMHNWTFLTGQASCRP